MEYHEEFESPYASETEVTREYDTIRLEGKSQEEDGDTRRGQSALVPGITYTRTLMSLPFNSYDTSPDSEPTSIQTDVQASYKVSHRPREPRHSSALRFSSSKVKYSQENERDLQSHPALYSIQSPSLMDSESNDANETTQLIASNTRKTGKALRKPIFHICKCTKSCVLFLAAMTVLLVMVLTLSAILAGISLSPGQVSAEIYIDNQDMVLLDFFNTFLYSTLLIHKALNNQCTDCKVEVYSFYPDNLIVGDNYFNISSGVLTATRADVLLAPKYYVSGSKIKMSVEFFPTKGQNSSVQFVIFNDLQQYEAYRRGDKTNPHQVYSVQVNEGKKFFSLSLMLTETGYYFIGIKPIDTSVTFQSTITAHQIYYSRADFPPPTCVLDSANSCTIQFTPSATDEYTDTLKMCVLVYSVPPQEVARSYFVSLDYEVYRGFWTSHSEGLLGVMLFSALLFFVGLCCCVFWCLVRYLRQKI